jgi:hypothetical protein
MEIASSLHDSLIATFLFASAGSHGGEATRVDESEAGQRSSCPASVNSVLVK